MCKGCECYGKSKNLRFVDIYVKCTFSFCFYFSLRVCLSSVWISCNVALYILFNILLYLKFTVICHSNYVLRG